jgi:hypothetical protein
MASTLDVMTAVNDVVLLRTRRIPWTLGKTKGAGTEGRAHDQSPRSCRRRRADSTASIFARSRPPERCAGTSGSPRGAMKY